MQLKGFDMSNWEDVTLPDDNYGFKIEGSRDLNSLKYLINEKGEEKLLKSLEKYKKKWPNSDPYVSTILKWYSLKIPPKLYRPVKIKTSHFVYIFSLKSNGSCKIGYSRDPAERMLSMNRDGFKAFDLQSSYAALFASEEEARIVEKTLKTLLNCDAKYSPYTLGEDSGFYYGSLGHSEWFDSSLLARAKKALADRASRKYLLTINSMVSL